MNKEKIILWLDDIRDPKDFLPDNEISYIWAKNYEEFIDMFEHIMNKYSTSNIILDLDHDLGENDKTGYDCLWYVINFCMDNNFHCPEVIVHSQNPVGSENMKKLFNNYKKLRS